MKCWFMTAIVVVLIVGSAATVPDVARAHEHWIDMESFYPDPPESLEIYVSSGHYFPKSSHALEAKVIDRLRVWSSLQEPLILETQVRDKMRVGTVSLENEGVYIVHLTLKRPRAKHPSYEAKALVVTSAAKDSVGRYGVGKGLELIPQQALSELRPGDKLPIVLSLDGNPVSGSIEVVPEEGKATFTSTAVDAPALVPLRNAGRYLVTAHAAGRGCSLTFEVMKGPE